MMPIHKNATPERGHPITLSGRYCERRRAAHDYTAQALPALWKPELSPRTRRSCRMTRLLAVACRWLHIEKRSKCDWPEAPGLSSDRSAQGLSAACSHLNSTSSVLGYCGWREKYRQHTRHVELSVRRVHRQRPLVVHLHTHRHGHENPPPLYVGRALVDKCQDNRRRRADRSHVDPHSPSCRRW